MQLRHYRQKGDTIVEVLIAITVLAFALGTGYATANRSTLAIQSNKERYQAQLLANKQVEFLRAASNTGVNIGVIGDGLDCIVKVGTTEDPKFQISTGNSCNDDSTTGVTYQVNTDKVKCSTVPTSTY